MKIFPQVGSQRVLCYSISVPETHLGTQSCSPEKWVLVSYAPPRLDLSVRSAGCAENEAQVCGHLLCLAHTFSAFLITQIIYTLCMYIINLPSIKKTQTKSNVVFFHGTPKLIYWLAATRKGSPALPQSSSFSYQHVCSPQPKKNWLRKLNGHKTNPAHIISMLYFPELSQSGSEALLLSARSCLMGLTVVWNPTSSFSSKKSWCDGIQISLHQDMKWYH